METTRYDEELRFVPASRFLLPEFLLWNNSNNIHNSGITDNFQTTYGKTSDISTNNIKANHSKASNIKANHSKASNSITYNKNAYKVTVEQCIKLCVSSKN